ncbi:MAG: histidine--tRNA ligase [Patescibacteria group bacterium]
MDTPAEVAKKAAGKPKRVPQLLRGMKDTLPEEQRYWTFVRQRVEAMAELYSYSQIATPLLEETSLFVRSIGKETDVIEKEIYSFEDKGGDSVALRPEGTAGVVRAYIEHGMLTRPQPVKLFYIGPFFRYDRPQAGRYRQFHQFGFEAIGDAHPVLDAQLMLLVYQFHAELGLPVTLQVNSIGTPQAREGYRKALLDYYRTRKNALCEDCRLRLQRNPLRLLDCKQPDCQLLAQEAPQIIDFLDEASNKHFVQVLEHLDSMEVPYVLNPRLVRGLDYYTGTVFEVWPEERPAELVEPLPEGAPPAEPPVKPGAQSALGGGGRYDLLVESLGGQPTPAIGFAIGIERLILELKFRDTKVGQEPTPDIFVAQLGDAGRKKALRFFEELRRGGFRVTEAFSKDGIKAQMELANRRKVKFTLIIGQKEIMDDTILIRDMESGIQETVDYQKAIPELQKRLLKYGVVEKNGNGGQHLPLPTA